MNIPKIAQLAALPILMATSCEDEMDRLGIDKALMQEVDRIYGGVMKCDSDVDMMAVGDPCADPENPAVIPGRFVLQGFDKDSEDCIARVLNPDPNSLNAVSSIMLSSDGPNWVFQLVDAVQGNTITISLGQPDCPGNY